MGNTINVGGNLSVGNLVAGNLIEETGDHFEVRYIQLPKGLECYGDIPEKTEKFVFQKDKDSFVTELLADDSVRSIEVGTFIKIK